MSPFAEGKKVEIGEDWKVRLSNCFNIIMIEEMVEVITIVRRSHATSIPMTKTWVLTVFRDLYIFLLGTTFGKFTLVEIQMKMHFIACLRAHLNSSLQKIYEIKGSTVCVLRFQVVSYLLIQSESHEKQLYVVNRVIARVPC